MPIWVVLILGIVAYYVVKGKEKSVNADAERKLDEAVEQNGLFGLGAGCLQSLFVGLPLGFLAMLILVGTMFFVAMGAYEQSGDHEPTTSMSEFTERYFKERGR